MSKRYEHQRGFCLDNVSYAKLYRGDIFISVDIINSLLVSHGCLWYLLDNSPLTNGAVVVFYFVLLTMYEIVAGETSQCSRGINVAGEWNLLRCWRFVPCGEVAVCEMYTEMLIALIDDGTFFELVLRYMAIKKCLDFVDAFDIILEHFGTKSS